MVARRGGAAAFLDKWHLVPGDPWSPAIERAIEGSATVAMFFGPSGVSGWHDEEKQLALDLAHRARQGGRRVIPVLLPGGRKEDVEGFLKLRTWVDLATHDGFIRLVAGIQGQAPELFAGLQPGLALRQRLADLSPAPVVVDPLARVRREIIDFSAERNRHKCFLRARGRARGDGRMGGGAGRRLVARHGQPRAEQECH